MSPNNVRQKAEKYRVLFGKMFVQSSLTGSKGLDVKMKHSTIRDLLAFFGELAEPRAEGKE